MSLKLWTAGHDSEALALVKYVVAGVVDVLGWRKRRVSISRENKLVGFSVCGGATCQVAGDSWEKLDLRISNVL